MQKFGSGVAHFLRRLFAGLLPVAAPEVVERRVLAVGTRIATDEVELRDRHEQLGVVGIVDAYEFGGTFFGGDRFQPVVSAYAVGGVHDRITLAQFAHVANDRFDVGGAPLAAIALGQGDRVRAGKILGNGFVLLILFTLLTSFIAYTFMEPILLFTGASANTLEYAVDYLSIYLLGTIFVEISTGLNSFINAQGRPAIAMFSVLIGALLNIILDPIFILDRKSTRLNSSHPNPSRMPSSA